MDTLSQLRVAVQDDLVVDDNSSLFSPTIIDRAINRAYRKAGALFPWSALQDSKKTTTAISQDYYDYPTNWRSNSIWKLRINLIRYGEDPDGSPLSFDDYLNWKEDYPDSTDKKWANQERRFFVTPTPTVADLLICIWGTKVTETLSGDSDTTIFSYHSQECNEAIVLETIAILKSKGDIDKGTEFRSAEAKQILASSWGKIRMENAKYEKNQPFFDVQDYYGDTTSVDMTGKFNYRV